MVEILHADPQKFNAKLAEKLAKMPEFLMPEWGNYVKTGISKMRPPEKDDYWYKRAASILRQISIKGIVGVNRLKTKYGSKKDRGMRPDKFFKASGKIIRTILQQAEKAGILEKSKEKKSGRKLTKKGNDLLQEIAAEVMKAK